MGRLSLVPRGEDEPMRFKARMATVMAVGTTFVYVAPASAQQGPPPTCSDFPTQVDMANSILPSLFPFDPAVLDPDGDGIGCEDNPGPPVPYNMVDFPPIPIRTGPPLEVSPTSGPPGTLITVHGEGCFPQAGERVLVGSVLLQVNE